MGHHAHMPKGVEVYKGKVIFHGLGQFIPVAIGLIGERAKAHRILAAPSISDLYGLKQGPAQLKSMIAKFVIAEKKITRVSYLPCLINEKQQPEILKHDERGQQLVDYINMLNKDEELDTVSEWDGDEVVIRT
jgi:poly-gamma-glutamate synthesis protein (capsule biosynthesis protein)